MAEAPVLLDLHEGVATLRLNRPERRNAVDLEMRAMTRDLIRRVAEDDAARALVITGSGGSFCAGGDIAAMRDAGNDGELARRRMRDTGETAVLLSTLGKPVISAVDGAAYGGGFGLALSADLVFVSPEARFCASFARLGLVPDFALHYALPRRVGVARAKEIVFSAREIGAEEALALGLADRIVPAETLVPEAQALAARLGAGSPTAIALSKTLLDQSFALDIRQMAEAESAAQALCFTTAFHARARERFLDKRGAGERPGWSSSREADK